MEFLKTILNGSYPTNPIWKNITLVVIFEMLVVIIEAVLISWYLTSRKTAISKETILFIVIVSNTLTFLLGFMLQVLLVGFV
jgi:hypothetical protein